MAQHTLQAIRSQHNRPRHSSPLQHAYRPYTEISDPPQSNLQSSHRESPVSNDHGTIQPDLQHSDNNEPAPIYPPRTSSLPGRQNHSQTHTHCADPTPPLPSPPPTSSATSSTASTTSTIITSPTSRISPSPISTLTIPQFQHNMYPILCVIASQMYRARLWREATRGAGDVLRVKPPTIGQTARRAEQIGWNLGWEGWRWG